VRVLFNVKPDESGSDPVLAELYLGSKGLWVLPTMRFRIANEITRLYHSIPVKVSFSPEEPYENAEELRETVLDFDILVVSTLNNDSPWLSKSHNLQFKAVHAYFNHVIDGLDLSLEGEFKAFQSLTARMTNLKEEDMDLMFSEMVLQANAALYLPGGSSNPRFSQKFVKVL
jgi:hypothetical protein